MALIYDNVTKFDNPQKTASQESKKVNQGFTMDNMRKALSSLNNRVAYGIAGTGGGTGFTGGSSFFITAGCTCGTNTTNGTMIAVTNSVRYTIDGVMYSLTATTTGTIGVLTTQGSASTCYYLISVGTNGTMASTNGGIVVTKGNDGTQGTGVYGFAFTTTPYLPDPPDNTCAIGYLKVAAAGTSAFCAGQSTLNDTANFTFTWGDLVHMPIVFGNE